MSDDNQFRVVSNHEDQHSIWSVGQEVPAGWTETGFTGSQEACLAHIAKVWTDLTPRSIRDRLEAAPK